MRITSLSSKFGNIFGLYHFELWSKLSGIRVKKIGKITIFNQLSDFSLPAILATWDAPNKTRDTPLEVGQQFCT